MINKFKINNFKCFDNFEVDNLGKVNILLGANNVGKSSFLEAIFGYACGKNLSPLIDHTILRLIRNNDGNLYSLTEKVLNTVNDKKKMEFEFEGNISNKGQVKYSYSIKPNPIIFGELNTDFGNNGSFIEDTVKYSNTTVNINGVNQMQKRAFFNLILKKNNYKEAERKVNFPTFMDIPTNEVPLLNGNIIYANTFKDFNLTTKIYSLLKRNPNEFGIFISELNKAFKNKVESFDMFPYPDGSPAPVSVKVQGREFVPIYEFGDGMQKWFSMVGSQMLYKDYIHCIDEIGDMLHPEAQGLLGLNLSEMAEKYNNQIFASTQSLEFVRNYLETVSSGKKELLSSIRIITLKNIEGSIKARVLEGEKALDLLMNNNMELR